MDGHPVGGAIVFSVGTAGRGSGPGTIARAPAVPIGLRTAHGIVRALGYAGTLLAAGMVLFLVLFGRHPVVDHRAVARPAVAATLVGAIATGIGLVVQSAMLAGGLMEALDPATVAGTLGSGVGVAALVRLGGLAALLAALARRELVPVLGTAGALAVAASFALTGHTVRLESPLLSALLVFHLLVVAFWVGSFAPLAQATRRPDVEGIRRLMVEFSGVAVLLVPALVAAGAGLAWFLVGGSKALVTTPYGLALSAKIALVAGMLALAAVNKWRLVPALPTARAVAARLRRSIALEAGLALAAFVVTAALTNMAPPMGRHEVSDGGASQTVSAKAGALNLVLTVTPALPGTNTLDLAVMTGSGSPKDVIEAWLHLGRPDLGVAEIARPMRHVGPGRYRLEGPELAIAGPWRIRADLLVSDFEKQTAEMLVTVGRGPDAHLH